jgi:hypothetical protein
VTSLVGIAMVDLREFGGIADEEQRGCHSNDRSYARSKTDLAADTNQGTSSHSENFATYRISSSSHRRSAAPSPSDCAMRSRAW